MTSLPYEHRRRPVPARGTDPTTSHEAARTATKHHPDQAVANIVEAVMRDGTPRIDEEIHAACVQAGCLLTDGRIRHGRKLLADQGKLIDTGERRRTRFGGKSRVWVYVNTGDPVRG